MGRLLTLSLPILALLASTPVHGQDSERALLILDPDDAQARYVTNYYLAAREIPVRNVLYMDPDSANYDDWLDVQLPGFFGGLANSGVEETVDFVIVPTGDRYTVSAPGLITDMCYPVNKFAVPNCFILSRVTDKILGGLNSSSINQYSRTTYGAYAFQSTISWYNGSPSTAGAAERYYIGAMLGWTLGSAGNTLTEVLDMIDRSVAVDSTQPAGTYYYMETTDIARSGPRHDAYPTAVSKIISHGGLAQHLLANLPLGNHDCLGVMTGLANPDITNPDFSVLPGAFCDHLTSYAGVLWGSGQTTMTEWITKGASATCGTVEEPCNYAGKFPHARLHVIYHRGLTAGEAWFRSVRYKPFQNLLLGDPLTRPFGTPPTVDVPSPPVGPQTGTIAITPTASANSVGGAIDVVELFVDGLRVESIAAGGSFSLDTTSLTDGWHELRVRAVDDVLWRNHGRWSGSLEVANLGRSVSLSATASSGDLGTLFDLPFTAVGTTVAEVVLLQHERVVASSSLDTGSFQIFGQNLGAGDVTVQAEARFADGSVARSAPVALTVDYSGGGGGATAPVAYDFTQEVREDQAFVLALPATFDDDPAGVTTTVVTPPAQASLLGGDGSWRVWQPAPDAFGTDTLVYRVSGAGGTSADATVMIVYTDVDGCDPVTHYCVTSPNSVGTGALIDHQGSVSIAANDLVLTVSEAPPGQYGIFFYGQGQTQSPVGDGYLCINSNFGRFSVVQTDSGGEASFWVDYDNPPGGGGTITPGSSWCFQFWYRDPGFGSAGNNLSDAFEALFCP